MSGKIDFAEALLEEEMKTTFLNMGKFLQNAGTDLIDLLL